MGNDAYSAGPVDVNVRPVIEAYKDHCGVSDARWDTTTDKEMCSGFAYKGYDSFRAGWDAALKLIEEEVKDKTLAIDGGGNKYRRPAAIDKLMPLIEKLRA